MLPMIPGLRVSLGRKEESEDEISDDEAPEDVGPKCTDPVLDSKGRETLFEELNMISSDPDLVSLTMGAPGPRELKLAGNLMSKATQYIMGSEKADKSPMLQYGPSTGSATYRNQLAKFLSHGYADSVDSNNLILTAGATHGLHLMASLFFRSGATVFVENPTYFLAIDLLKKDLGMNIVSVPTDSEGTDIKALDRLLMEHRPKSTQEVSERLPFWAMLYVIPVYNNPTGKTYPPARCRQLVKLARKHDVLLLSEDVYNLLHYNASQSPPPRLMAYDRKSDPGYKGHVVSNCTFSKILSPGVRVGWIEAPDRIVDYFKNSTLMFSGGAVNHYASEVVAASMDMGLEQEHLQHIIAENGARMKAVCKILKENLEGVKFSEPGGGYFIWLELPEGTDGDALASEMLEKIKIKVVPGSSCSPIGGCKNCLRISISYYPEDVLREATFKLCNYINNYLLQEK